MSNPILLLQKAVRPKEKGRRRTSDWCAISMEDYKFLSIDEITGREFLFITDTTREECYVKKTANCRLCEAIYALWTKDKLRGKRQNGPIWKGAVRH